MSDNKQILAKLDIIENMATESSVKQLTKVIKEFIKDQNKTSIGFKKDKAKDE